MVLIDEDDWSDSDEEVLSEETSVSLGVPDGAITDTADTHDAAVSRIGGHAAFLLREPPFSASQCKSCSNPSELLVQMWCPFEDSPMDRALYIWGCSRGECQGKDGSVRAWRGLRYNERYAAKLNNKLARKQEQERAKADAEATKKPNNSSNPFAVNPSAPNPFSTSSNNAANPFSLGNQIFGQAPVDKKLDETQNQTHPEEGDESDSESTSSTESLVVALATTTVAESPWKAAPAYPALYLSTLYEYIPPPPKTKLPPVEDPLEESGKGRKDTKDVSWAYEPYENSLDVDHVFERFTKRVAYESAQCVRYDLGGQPLPFTTDAVFESLYPAPPAPSLPITKAAFTVVPTQKRTYTTSSIPTCATCGSERVFECQLMPNLINILKKSSNDVTDGKTPTDDERRKEVLAALHGKIVAGMEWGTLMVFSCKKDCCLSDDGKSDAKDAWREEIVRIQWDLLTASPRREVIE